MPKIKLEIIKIKPPKNIDNKRDLAFAFLVAAKYVLKSDSLVAVADVDLIFQKPITDIKRLPFDIAVTVRNKIKYNTGQADRQISTGKLNASPHVHILPINLVIFEVPDGDISSRRGLGA